MRTFTLRFILLCDASGRRFRYHTYLGHGARSDLQGSLSRCHTCDPLGHHMGSQNGRNRSASHDHVQIPHRGYQAFLAEDSSHHLCHATTATRRHGSTQPIDAREDERALCATRNHGGRRDSRTPARLVLRLGFANQYRTRGQADDGSPSSGFDRFIPRIQRHSWNAIPRLWNRRMRSQFPGSFSSQGDNGHRCDQEIECRRYRAVAGALRLMREAARPTFVAVDA